MVGVTVGVVVGVDVIVGVGLGDSPGVRVGVGVIVGVGVGVGVGQVGHSAFSQPSLPISDHITVSSTSAVAGPSDVAL